jgi:hypothetical protein
LREVNNMSDERNPYGLNPGMFPTETWERYLECGDITLLPRRLIILASTVSLGWAADNNNRTVVLFQPNNLDVPTERDIVVPTSRKFEGHRAHDFAGKLFVAGRADNTIARVSLKPGYTPGYEILHSPRWALANPAALDDLRRSLALKELLANAGS